MKHIQTELDRISERLRSHPHPNEHAGLFAAQQALEWARNPNGFRSPFDTATGTQEAHKGYCRSDRQELSEDTSFQMTDAPLPQDRL